MQRLFPVPLLLLFLLCFGCHEKTSKISVHRQNDEIAGAQALDNARRRLDARDYEGARRIIRAMRHAHPLALTARENGILLMDSIDLVAAREAILQAERSASADTATHTAQRGGNNGQLPELYRRLRFFERKLQHDFRQRKSHD
jgi:hypothetical protein